MFSLTQLDNRDDEFALHETEDRALNAHNRSSDDVEDMPVAEPLHHNNEFSVIHSNTEDNNSIVTSESSDILHSDGMFYDTKYDGDSTLPLLQAEVSMNVENDEKFNDDASFYDGEDVHGEVRRRGWSVYSDENLTKSFELYRDRKTSQLLVAATSRGR